MPIQAEPPAPEQASNPYLPPGPNALVFEQFQGINTSTSRAGVRDQEMWWSDGFFPIGPRLLRTIPGAGPELWNVSQSLEPAGTLISFFDFVNIGVTPYCIVVLTNGSIYAINTNTGVANRIAPAGTLTNASRFNVGMTQYGNQYLLIIALQVNGYFIWDGTTFFVPGDSFGGGMVPTAIGGNAIEVYAGRVWIATEAIITFSAPGSLIDFSSGSGGGQFQSTDSFLRIAFIGLKQSNGFLYLVGDSSLNYISGVQTGGSPLVTTFTNQNADPEVGSPWPGTINTFGRNILFANSFGVHISYGAAVTKISEPLDGVYATFQNLAGFSPSAAKAIIFGKKVWVLLLPIVDPFTGQSVFKLFLWTGKLWFATSQDVTTTFIQHQEIASVLTAWATDNQGIWPLFQQPSDAFTKIAQSKLWDNPVGYEALKSTNRLWGLVQYFDYTETEISVLIDNETPADSTGVIVETESGSMTWTGLGGATMTWTGPGSAPMTWISTSGGIAVLKPQAVAQNGALLGMTVLTNGSDLAIVSLKIQPEVTGYRG
jgi:hypothetical protein